MWRRGRAATCTGCFSPRPFGDCGLLTPRCPCRWLLQKSRVQIWLYEQTSLRLEGRIVVRGSRARETRGSCAPRLLSAGVLAHGAASRRRPTVGALPTAASAYALTVVVMALPIPCQGFDEYMNLVLDDAEEVDSKKKSRRAIGACCCVFLSPSHAVVDGTPLHVRRLIYWSVLMVVARPYSSQGRQHHVDDGSVEMNSSCV